MGRGSEFVSGEKLSRREFLRRVIGTGGVAVAALALAACVPGEEEDDDDEEEED
jgi:hypothetical protein